MQRLRRRVLSVVHVANLTTLLTLSIILLLATVDRPWHLVFPSTILLLAALYWRLRGSTKVVACYFSLSMATILWILVGQNIVTIDNLLRTKMSKRLTLGLELQSYVQARFHDRPWVIEGCCGDPLAFHLKPGSAYRAAYDCPKFANCKSYEVTVDETGHLNGQHGFMEKSRQIDFFLAGDSVMQGVGSPGVLQSLRERIPLTMWDLSIAGYGPRQKVSALITYALPKEPKWLVIDFYSGNDITDAICDVACESTGDFRCLFAEGELWRRLSTHSVYGWMLAREADSIEWLTAHAPDNLTLAMTRHVMNTVKNTTREILLPSTKRRQPAEGIRRHEPGLPRYLSYPATARFDIRADRRDDWVASGMDLTLRSYERLATRLGSPPGQPWIILLYNPSAYEIYRDILLDRNPAHDRVSAFQMDALKAFTEQKGWIFLDLTGPLRKNVEPDKTWIFGRLDGIHWSPMGTARVADVLSAELSRIIRSKGE